MDAKVASSETNSGFVGWRPERCERIALIFQGGGALGAYQAGVYEALHEADIEPDWVTGVSIGAINASIIAGNPREKRLERLRAFWNKITDRRVWAFTPDGDVFRRARNLFLRVLPAMIAELMAPIETPDTQSGSTSASCSA